MLRLRISGAVPPLFNTPLWNVQEHLYVNSTVVVRDTICMFHCLARALTQTEQPESPLRRCKFAVEWTLHGKLILFVNIELKLSQKHIIFTAVIGSYWRGEGWRGKLDEGEHCALYPIRKRHSDLSSQRTPGGMCVILGFRREVHDRELPSSGLLRSV